MLKSIFFLGLSLVTCMIGVRGAFGFSVGDKFGIVNNENLSFVFEVLEEEEDGVEIRRELEAIQAIKDFNVKIMNIIGDLIACKYDQKWGKITLKKYRECSLEIKKALGDIYLSEFFESHSIYNEDFRRSLNEIISQEELTDVSEEMVTRFFELLDVIQDRNIERVNKILEA